MHRDSHISRWRLIHSQHVTGPIDDWIPKDPTHRQPTSAKDSIRLSKPPLTLQCLPQSNFPTTTHYSTYLLTLPLRLPLPTEPHTILPT